MLSSRRLGKFPIILQKHYQNRFEAQSGCILQHSPASVSCGSRDMWNVAHHHSTAHSGYFGANWTWIISWFPEGGQVPPIQATLLHNAYAICWKRLLTWKGWKADIIRWKQRQRRRISAEAWTLCVAAIVWIWAALNCRKEPSWATFIVPNLVRQSKSLMGPQREPLKRKPNVKELILILRKDQSLWKSYEKAY